MQYKIRTKITVIIIIIFMIILIISSYFLLQSYTEYKKSKDSNVELINKVIIERNNEESIDWNKLEEINKDIVGWIKIEDTKIDYPILKDSNKLKYLKHSFDGSYNNNGSVFTLNENPFQDCTTVVYGHNMKNGLMFSELKKYMNEKFLNQHSSFKIYTKNQNYQATIFSCYSTEINEEDKNIKSLKFKEEIEYYKSKSNYSINNIGKIEKIVKLSTCSYLNNHTNPTNQRYYVVAKLEELE